MITLIYSSILLVLVFVVTAVLIRIIKNSNLTARVEGNHLIIKKVLSTKVLPLDQVHYLTIEARVFPNTFEGQGLTDPKISLKIIDINQNEYLFSLMSRITAFNQQALSEICISGLSKTTMTKIIHAIPEDKINPALNHLVEGKVISLDKLTKEVGGDVYQVKLID